MKLDKKQALTLSNVLFLHLNDDNCGVAQLDVEELYQSINDYLLSEDTQQKTESVKTTKSKNKVEVSAKSEVTVSASDLHELEEFSNLEFEFDDECDSLSLLVGGYAEHSDITSVKRTAKSLQVWCDGELFEQKLDKKNVPSDWKSLLPLDTVIKVEF